MSGLYTLSLVPTDLSLPFRGYLHRCHALQACPAGGKYVYQKVRQIRNARATFSKQRRLHLICRKFSVRKFALFKTNLVGNKLFTTHTLGAQRTQMLKGDDSGGGDGGIRNWLKPGL